MSIFDTIIFDEFTLLEGEQAEAYKKRKAEEKEKAIHQDNKRTSHRNDRNVGIKTPRYDTMTGKRSNSEYFSGIKKEDEDKFKKDLQNRDKASKVFNREIERRNNDKSGKIVKVETDDDGDITDKSYGELTRAADATMRHIRRHPKQYAESAFEDIEMI